MDWLNAVSHCRTNNLSCVVVMITEVTGSSPRSVGTRMVVTGKHIYGTIGGGALEMEGISHARALLDCRGDIDAPVSTRQFNLGVELSQCCGGKVALQFDCHFANDFVLHVFGAGHVAQEVVRLVQRLPIRTFVHDTREDWLAQVDGLVSADKDTTSTITTCLIRTSIFQYIESLQPSAYYLTMTHSHEMDMEVVEAVLTRSDAAYCGLIASASKAAKFRNRLKRKGFNASEIGRLTAPLGQGVKTGNTPMEVAIAGIGDVLTVRATVKNTGHNSLAGIISKNSE